MENPFTPRHHTFTSEEGQDGHVQTHTHKAQGSTQVMEQHQLDWLQEKHRKQHLFGCFTIGDNVSVHSALDKHDYGITSLR